MHSLSPSRCGGWLSVVRHFRHRQHSRLQKIMTAWLGASSRLNGDPICSQVREPQLLPGLYLSKLITSASSLPQQTQTVESISGHTYIRKRISLTFFVKKLILWSEGLSQGLLGGLTCFICRAVTFFNKINLHPHNSYYLRNTIKLIRRTGSIINKYLYLISPRDIKQKAPPNG